MAVGTYTLPICDGCKLPWLPVGWTQDSDPRNVPHGTKPLRCGKCKSPNWDREFVKQAKADATEGDVAQMVRAQDEPAVDTSLAEKASPDPEVAGSIPAVSTNPRCKHRMTDCPICHPKGGRAGCLESTPG